MNKDIKIAVASRSFSKNIQLRKELLNEYECVTFNELGKTLAGEELVKFLLGHDRAIIALEKIDETILSKLPTLKVISKYGVGLDSLNYDALLKNNIQLGWIKGVNKRSVAELALSFALVLLRKTFLAYSEVKIEKWYQIIGNELTGKTFGIIGFGNVGKELFKLLQPFECKILCYDTIDQGTYCKTNQILQVSVEELLSQSDVISLHIPFNEKNRNFLDRQKLALIKSGAVLINTARGNLLDEGYLKELLISNKIAAAGFDVFSSEPPCDMELLSLQNFLATPHIGGSSQEAILAMGRAAILGLKEYCHVSSFKSEW